MYDFCTDLLLCLLFVVLSCIWCVLIFDILRFFFFSGRRRHTRCALVTGVQTCALPISFALPARIVLLSSPPHIMGHAVADVYDAEHRLAALVDTNKKMVFFLRDADAGFFETVLAERDEAKRRTILESAVVVTFPMDVRYFNPSDGH